MSKKTQTESETTLSTPPTPEITLGSIKELGIPLLSCTFHKAVQSLIDGTPEYKYYDHGSMKVNRNAKLWYYRDGVLMSAGQKHKLIPLAQVAESEVL